MDKCVWTLSYGLGYVVAPHTREFKWKEKLSKTRATMHELQYGNEML